MVEIDGKSVGTSNPSNRGDERAGNLTADILAFVRKPGVQREKEKCQQRQRENRPETDQADHEPVQYREKTEQQALQGRAKHYQNQGKDTHQEKYDGITGVDDAPEQVVSAFAAVNDAVQPALDSQHPAGSRPDGGHGGRREQGSRGDGLDVLNCRLDQWMDADRKQPHHHVHQILRADGRNKLNQRQQNHDKGRGGEYDKKRSLGGIHRDLVFDKIVVNLFTVQDKRKHK